MDDLIVKPKKSTYLLFTSVLLAVWNIHPFYTLFYNWFIYFKISVILILLGFDFQYKFTKNQKAIKEYTFLKMPFLRRKIVEVKIDYVSVFKTTTATKYQIRLFYNSKYFRDIYNLLYFLCNCNGNVTALIHFSQQHQVILWGQMSSGF